MSIRGSAEWCEKIARSKDKFRVKFACDNCGLMTQEGAAHYKLAKRHFCNRACYSIFRRDQLPKEEQHAYGTGWLCFRHHRQHHHENPEMLK